MTRMTAPFSVTCQISMEDARFEVKRWMNRGGGWMLTASDEKSFTYTRTIKPDVGVALVLFLLGIFPGLLYLVLAWKKETRNIYFSHKGKETQIVVDSTYN